MAGLGKSKPGYASKGGEAKRAPKQPTPTSTRHEHEGRTPQPGVPAGPRDTQYPSSRGYRYSPAETAQGKEERRYEKAVKNTPTIKAVVKNTGGVDPLNAVETALGLNKSSTLTPGGDTARKFAEAEGKKLLDTAKENFENERKGLPSTPTSQKNLEGLAAITSVVPAGEVGRAVGAGEKALQKAATQASNAETAAKAASKVVAKVKATPKNIAKDVKSYPGRKVRSVKSAPRRAKETVARAPELKTKAGQKSAAKAAGKTTLKHPLKVGVPAAAALPPGTNIEGFDPGQRARAFLQGSADAIIQHPGEVAATTGQGILGFATAPLAISAAVVDSAKKGSLKPLTTEAGHLIYQSPEETGTGREGGIVGMTKSLASGDPQKVEETTLSESGAIPFIPGLHIAKRLKNSSAYEGARGSARNYVEGRRAKARVKRVAREKAAKEAGEFVGRKQAKKADKQPVRDSARQAKNPGESYIVPPVGRFVEKQRGRHVISRDVSRMQREGEHAAKGNSETIAKPLRKSKGTNQKEQNDADALAVILKHGLPLDQSTLDFARRLKNGYGNEDYPAGVHLDRNSVQWIIDHPEMFEGKRGAQLTKAVEAYDHQSKGVGTSPRHQYLAQVLNIINPTLKEQGKHPMLLPEEMVPPGTSRLLPKRDHEWSRDEALDYAKQSGGELGKKIERSLDGLMKSPKHGGAEGGVSTTQAVAWTPEMVSKFVAQAKAHGRPMGLRDPAAYVANRVPSGLKGAEPNFSAGIPINKIWPSRGKAAMSGNAQSDFEHLMHSSVEGPRHRAATINGLNRIFDRASTQIDGKRYLTEAQWNKAVIEHKVPPGVIPVRTQALTSLLQGEHHLSPEEFHRELMAEIEHGQKLSAGEELAGEIQAAKEAHVKGDKYAPMNAVEIHELMGHMKPPGDATRYGGYVTNAASRLILNNPAFLAIQVPQEAIPLAASMGRNVVHIPTALRNIKTMSELPPEDLAAAKAVWGSSAGLMGTPSAKALRSDGYMNPIRAAGKPSAWRVAWDIVNGNMGSKFDRSRAGYFREVAGMAKVHGDLKRAEKGFNLWRHSTNNLFKHEQEAVEAMKGMDFAQRQIYVAQHPRLGDQLMKDLNGQGGNWNSFTVFEKQFAPLTLFYTFQRYSVLWMLYHFPLDHPVVATALASLGAVNAQELKKLAAAGGQTPNILDYTMPVVQHPVDEAEYQKLIAKGYSPEKAKTIASAGVLPVGLRNFPGLSTLQQTAVTGKPSQLIGELPPVLSIPAEAALGKSSYTGQDIGENGWTYALRQTGRLSSFGRFFGVPELGSSPSPASQAFGKEDPLRRSRSTLDPFIGQSGSQYVETKRLEKGFKNKYSKNAPPSLPAEYWEAAYNHDWKLAKKLKQEVLQAEQGSEVVKAKEAPYYTESQPFDKEAGEILQYITGTITIPVEPTKKKKEGQYGSGGGQYSSAPGQYSKGTGPYSSSAGQYGGG